jgi:hypothetical protein
VDALRFEELLARARSAGRAGDAGQAAELVAQALALASRAARHETDSHAQTLSTE